VTFTEAGFNDADVRERWALRYRRLRETYPPGEWLCAGLLVGFMVLYVWAYSAKSIHAYTIGETYFDLAVFEQSFWNALRGTLFFNSLEGNISHFGRHFSPFFYLLLPFYALRPHPTTLLLIQTVALALAAVPLYLIARRRLTSPYPALVVAAVFLANPALHDVDLIHEFHELAFAVPVLFLAFYAVETRRWRLFGVMAVLALTIKEDVALAVAALGLYVLLVSRQRVLGIATVAASIFWFVVVVEIVMPALRGPLGAVPFPGYDYLGDGVIGIAAGILTSPAELWQVVSSDPKQEYLKWLLLPVAFLALLAPEVLLIGLPSLMVILASTHPPTYVIFERYVAPVLPFVFLAAVVGMARTRWLAEWFATRAGYGALHPATRRAGYLALALCSLVLVAGTAYAQRELEKYPDRLWYDEGPGRNATSAISLAEAVPPHASVTIEDHRYLVRAAQRRDLYYLSGPESLTEYVLVNRRISPVTNQPHLARESAKAMVIESGDYLPLRCENGVVLYVEASVYQRDGDPFEPYRWEHDYRVVIDERLRLNGYDVEPPEGPADHQLRFTFYWQATGELLALEHQLIMRVLDEDGRMIAEQHDRLRNSCATALWPEGYIVPSWHRIDLPPETPPGDYVIDIFMAEGPAPVGPSFQIEVTR
jgi:uncharacterized membrane protein